jgi:indole-3-acetate monooxygenase
MTGNGVTEKLTDLLPEIRERREEIEQARKLPRDLVDKLIGTGVFKLAVPRAIGGIEAPTTEQMRVVELISAADGSTGWCTMIGLGNNSASGAMNEIGAKEIFPDPSLPTVGTPAPIGAAVREDGGVRVSGRWPFASGITHVEWLFAGSMVMENGQPKMTPHGPEIIHTWIPVNEVEVHDTWYVSGLSGTGSNDYTVKDVFVPDHRIFSLFDPSGHRPEPLYQMPIVVGFCSVLACVGLGIARAALDEITGLVQTKVPAMSMAVAAEKASTQIELARLEADLGSARAFLYETVDDLWRTVSAGDGYTPRQNALARIAATNAVQTAAAVTSRINTLGGGSSMYSKSALQRHMRDADAVTHHFTVAPSTWEDAGRVLLGRPPTAPVF